MSELDKVHSSRNGMWLSDSGRNRRFLCCVFILTYSHSVKLFMRWQT